MAPSPTSKIIGSIPDASSTINNIFSEWNPWNASGVSFLAVRATANDSLGADTNSTLSFFTARSDFSPGGSFLYHFAISPHKTSDNWCPVGAVQATFAGYLVKSHHSIIQLSKADLPTPCPDLTATRSLFLIASIAFFCHSSGSTPKA